MAVISLRVISAWGIRGNFWEDLIKYNDLELYDLKMIDEERGTLLLISRNIRIYILTMNEN